jgi:hypothetical protein
METSRDFPAGAAGPPPGRAADQPTEGIGTLITGLIKDLQDLVRAEIRLAKLELQADAKQIGGAAGMLVAGGVVGLVGFIFLMLTLMYLLNEWIGELWISAGVVTLALVIATAILVSVGRNRLREANLTPEQTIATLKEDQAWASQQINSVRR